MVRTLSRSVVISLRWLRLTSAMRKQHDDADARHVMKGVRDGRAGVAAGGGENGDLLAVFAQKMPEHPRHHLRGEILERRRRALVQPHQENAVVNFFQRDRKIVGVAANRGQIVVGNDALGIF